MFFLEVGQDMAHPEKNQDHQMIVDEVWDHGMAPLHGGDRRPFYLVLRPKELSAAIGYTTEIRSCPCRLRVIQMDLSGAGRII